jgi:hypothetical protein
MRSLDGKAALLWLDDQSSRLSACSDACLGVALDLVALAMLIYGEEGSTHLSELTVDDTVGYARDLLVLAEDSDCLLRGLFLAWLIQDAVTEAETKLYQAAV